jgi:peptidoglycan/LPS O-acetylase OafA/YrhL
MAPQTRVPDRDQSLDTLRGGAIALVLVGHYLNFAPYQLAGVPVRDWVQDFGHAGVLLFFILSGYLIYITARDRPWGVFLTKRLAKIVPAYWINVAFVFLAGLTLHGFPQFALKDALANLLFLEGSSGFESLSGVYWTLVIEVKFYLVFALVFYTPARPWLLLVPVVALIANLGALGAFGRTSVFLTYLPAFFVGIAFARHQSAESPAWIVPALLAIAAAGIAAGATHRALPAAVCLLLDAAVFAALRSTRGSIGWLSSLGLISYSVYLYHTTLGYPLLDLLNATGMIGTWPLAASAVLALVVAISYASFRLIEVPSVYAVNTILRARASPKPLPPLRPDGQLQDQPAQSRTDI